MHVTVASAICVSQLEAHDHLACFSLFFPRFSFSLLPQVLDSLIQAARGIFPLRSLLVDLSSQRNFCPQTLVELVLLVKSSRLERAALLRGQQPTKMGRRSLDPLIVQIERARRDVERQNRAADRAAAHEAAYNVALALGLGQPVQAADHGDEVIFGDPNQPEVSHHGSDVDSDDEIVVVPPSNPVVPSYSQERDEFGRFTPPQREALASAIKKSNILERCRLTDEEVAALVRDKWCGQRTRGQERSCCVEPRCTIRCRGRLLAECIRIVSLTLLFLLHRLTSSIPLSEFRSPSPFFRVLLLQHSPVRFPAAPRQYRCARAQLRSPAQPTAAALRARATQTGRAKERSSGEAVLRHTVRKPA